ncbi:Ig-like domain-containing protein [bacterium]|nr:Ig-like domain-containing protein [bacterium]
MNALPSVNAGVDFSICAGSTATLAATGATSYVWDNGVTNGTSFIPTATATYTVTGTDANGCVATDDITVTVNPLPTVSGSTSVCVDETVTLTGSGTAATSNAWVSSDVGVATVSSVGVVTGVSAGSVNITYTNNNGCQKLVAMTVNAVPTISGSLSTIIGGTTTLSGSGTPATTGAWTSSSQSVATVSSSGVVTGLTAGTTNITYTTSSGCSVTETVTIYAMPTITSGGVSGPQEVCVGSTIDFDGSGTAATSSPWTSSNTSVASIDSDGLVTGVSAGTATITYTDNNGGTATQTVTVNPLPTISGTTSVCIGSSVTLTGNGTAATSNAWTSSNTSVATVSSTGEVTGVAAGTATITYTNNNGCSITETVTVNALPTITGTFAVCVDATVTLSGSGTASTTTPWVSGDNSIATVSSSGVVTGVAAGSVNITYTDNNGCQTTQAITVNALPTVSAGADQTICSGSSVTLSGSGAVSYSWDNSVVNNTAFVPTATATYTVTGTNANGCIATDEVVVTVNDAPIITGDTELCIGESIDLDATGTPATSNAWLVSNPGVISIQNASLGIFLGAAAGTSTITYTDATGCSNSVTVTVNALPVVSAGTDYEVCDGESTVLSATGATSYAWDNGVTNGTSFIPTATATYTVTGTDANGCVETDEITVTVNDLPIITGATSLSIGNSTTLATTSTSSLTNPWSVNNSTLATISSSGVLTASSVGTVVVTYEDDNGCTNTYSVNLVAQPTITATPNPALSPPAVAVCIGESITLIGSNTPDPSTPWTITSATSSILTVDNYGVVTGMSQGTGVVVYTDSYGGQATQEVEVLGTPSITGTMNACPGESVTLLGVGDYGVTGYSWASSNGTVATFTNTSSGTISALATGTTTVTYTNGAGCSTSQTFTVNALPIDPVIAFDDGSSSPYATCPDGGIKIVVSNSASSIATSYKWYRNGSEIVYGSSTWNSLVTSSTANSITVNAGGVYKAKGISGNSCESGASNQLTITDSSPNAAPVLSLSNVVNGKICPQTTATITASSLNGYSYLWYESSFQNSSNKTLITPNGATNDSHTTSSEKTYYVRFVDNMGCMGPEATINVDYLEGLSQPLPVINDYAVCNADELVLTVLNKQYYVTYTWSAVNSTTGGAVSSGLSPASETYRRHSYQQNETNDAVINPQSYDINGHLNSLSLTYKVESSLNGCTLDSTIGQPVVINGTPSDVPEITSVQGSSPIELCPNTSTTLSLSTTPVTGLTYEWEVKPNTGSWTIGNTTAEANKLYRVRSKYPSTGCYSPYSESFIINEKSIPQPVLTFNGLAGSVNTDYLCGTQSGDYVELTVDNYINDYDPGTIFKLVDQSGTTVSSITGVGTTTNPYFTISTPSVYTVIAESGQCVSSPSATKEVKEVPIVKPNIVETSNNTVVCENNETITLGINNSNYFSTNNGIEYRYSWYQIGSISNTLLSENATYSSASAFDYDNTQWGTSTSLSENYYVVLQAKEQGSSRYLGCSTSDTITITINKAPDAPSIVRTSTQTPTNISLCDGDEEQISVLNGSGTYEWYNLNINATNDIGTGGSTFMVDEQGIYVAKSLANGCLSQESNPITAADLGIAQPVLTTGTGTSSTTICSAGSASKTLYVNYPGLTDGMVFELFRKDNGVATSTNQFITYSSTTNNSIEFSVNTPGEYQVQASSTDCESALSNVVALISSQQPDLTITGSYQLCDESNTALSVPNNSANNAFDFEWFKLGQTPVVTQGKSLATDQVETGDRFVIRATSKSDQSCVFENTSSPFTIVALDPKPTLSDYQDTISDYNGTASTTITSSQSGVFLWSSESYTTTSLSFSKSAGGSYTVRKLNQTTGCYSLPSDPYVITEMSIPSHTGTLPSSVAWSNNSDTVWICPNSGLNITINDTSYGTTYTLRKYNSNDDYFASRRGNCCSYHSYWSTISGTNKSFVANENTPPVLTIEEDGIYTIIASKSGYYDRWSSNYFIIEDTTGVLVPTLTQATNLTGTSACEGTEILLSAGNLQSDARIEWYNVDEPNTVLEPTDSDSSKFNVTESGTYNVRVAISGCLVSATSPVSYTFMARPAKPVLDKGPTENLCDEDDYISITNSYTTSTNIRYSWAKNGSHNPYTYSATNYFVQDSGDYRVVVQDFLTGCYSDTSDIVEYTYNKYTRPTYQVYEGLVTDGVTLRQPVDTICSNGEFSIELEDNNMQNGVTYQLQKLGVSSWSDVSGKTITYNPSVTVGNYWFESLPIGYYRIKAYRPGKQCDPSYSDTIIMRSNYLPPPTFSGPNPVILCEGSNPTNLYVQNNPATTGRNVTYIWTDTLSGRQLQGVGNKAIVPVNQSGHYVVTMNYDNCSVQSESALIVQVNSKPDVPLVFKGFDAITNGMTLKKCDSSSVTLNINPMPLAPTTIFWLDTNNTIKATGVSQEVFDYPGEFGVIAKLGDCYSDTLKFTIENVIAEKPAVSNAANGFQICPGDSVQLEIEFPVAGNLYVWYKFSDAAGSFLPVDTSVGMDPIYFDQPGSYHVRSLVTESDDLGILHQCLSSQASDLIIIQALSRPSPPAFITNPTICEGDAATTPLDNFLTNNSANLITHWLRTSDPNDPIDTNTNALVNQMYQDFDQLTDTAYVFYESRLNGCKSFISPFVLNGIKTPPTLSTNDMVLCNNSGNQAFDLRQLVTSPFDSSKYQVKVFDSNYNIINSPYTNYLPITDTTYETYYFRLQSFLTGGQICYADQFTAASVTLIPNPDTPMTKVYDDYCVGDDLSGFTDRVEADNQGMSIVYFDLAGNPLSKAALFSANFNTKDTSATFYISNAEGQCYSPKYQAYVTVQINATPSNDIFTTNNMVEECWDENIDLSVYTNNISAPFNLMWYSDTANTYIDNPLEKIPGTLRDTMWIKAYKVNEITTCRSELDSIQLVLKQNTGVVSIKSQDPVCPNTTQRPISDYVSYDATKYSLAIYDMQGSQIMDTIYDTYAVNNPLQSYYKFRLTDNDGCLSQSYSMTIQRSDPIITPITNDTTFCLGNVNGTLSDRLDLTLAQYANVDTLYWYTSFADSIPKAEPDIELLQTTEDYWVSAVNKDGCEGPKAKVTIGINELSGVSYTASTYVVPYGGLDTLIGYGANIYTYYYGTYDPQNPTVGLIGTGNPLIFSPDSAQLANATNSLVTVRGQDTLTGCVGTYSAQILFSQFDGGSVQSNPNGNAANGPIAAAAPGASGGVVSSISGEQSICSGQIPLPIYSDQFPTGGTGSYTFSWLIESVDVFDTSATIYQNTPYFIFTPQLVDSLTGGVGFQNTFTVTRIANSGTARAYSNEVVVEVIPYPDFYISEHSSGDTLTQYLKIPTGHKVDLVVTPTNGNFSANYGVEYDWFIVSDSIPQLGVNNDTLAGLMLDSGYNEVEARVYALDADGYRKCYRKRSIEIDVIDLIPGSITQDQIICYDSIPAPILEDSAASGGNDDFYYEWQVQSVNASGNVVWSPMQMTVGSNPTPTIPNGKNLFFDPSFTLQDEIVVRRAVRSLTVTKYTNNIEIDVVPEIPVIPASLVQMPDVCFGDTVGQLYIPSTATGLSVIWMAHSGQTRLDSAPTPAMIRGEQKWSVKQRDNVRGCEGDLTSVVFEYIGEPDEPNVLTTPVPVCSSDTNGRSALTFVNNNAIGASLAWFKSDTLTPYSQTPRLSWKVDGDTSVIFVQAVDDIYGCKSEKVPVRTYSKPRPTYEILTSDHDRVLCAIGDTNLSTLATLDWGNQVADSSSYTITWYGTDGTIRTGRSVTLSPDSSTLYTISLAEDTANGRYGCVLETTPSLYLTVIQPVDTPATITANYCVNEPSYPVENQIPQNQASYGNFQWYEAPNFNSVIDSVPHPPTDIVKTLTYYYTDHDPVYGCPTVFGTSIVNIHPAPLPVAVDSLALCFNDTSSTDLSDFVSIDPFHNAIWYSQDTATQLISSPVVRGSQLTGDEYYFVLQRDTNGCSSLIDTVKIDYLSKPVADITSVDPTQVMFEICKGDSITVVLETTHNFGSIEWYEIDGADTTLIHLGLSTSLAPINSISLMVLATDFEGCTSTYQKYLSVQNPPGNPNMLDTAYCQGDTAAPIMPLSLQAGNSLLWHRTNGTIDTVSFLPAPSSVVAGTFYRYVQQFNPVTGCVSEMDTAVIEVRALPSAPLTQTREVCEGNTGQTSPIAWTTDPSYVLHWFESDSITKYNGTPQFSGSTLDSSKVYLVKQQDLISGCYSAFSAAQVDLIPKPTAEIFSTDSLFKTCEGESITLGLTLPNKFNFIRWNVERQGYPTVYNQGTGATFTHTPISSTVYVAEGYTDQGCGYSYRQMVTVQPVPVRPALNDYEYCQYEDAFPITADSLSGGNVLLWHQPNGVIDTVLSIPAPPTGVAGTFFFFAQQYNPITGCESVMDTAVVHIIAAPIEPTTEPIIVCEDNITQIAVTAVNTLGYDGFGQPYGIMHWYDTDSVTEYAQVPMVSGSTISDSTYFLVRQEDARTGCLSGLVSAQVNFIEKPIAQIVSVGDEDFNICIDDQITLAITPTDDFASVVWDVKSTLPDGTPVTYFAQGTGATFVHTPDTTSRYIATVTTIYGCTYTFEQLVTVQPLPARPTIPIYEYCQFEDATATVSSNLKLNNKLLWHRSNGSIDTLINLPAPSTLIADSIYRSVQQYNPVTGCVSDFEIDTTIVFSLPIKPTTQPINLCEESGMQVALSAVNTLGFNGFGQPYGIMHWYDTDSVTEFSQTPLVSGSTITDTTYYLVRQEDSRTGCLSSFVSAQVNFISKPEAQITSSDVDFNICDGDQISLGITPNTGLSSIVWDVRTTLPDGSPITFFAQGTGATFVHRPDTTSEYIVRITNTYGCDYTLKQLVSVQALPKKPGIPDTTYYCQSEDALSMTGASLEVSNKLLWHRSTGLIDTLTVLPAPQTDTTGTFYRYVQQYDPLTGCVSEMDTAVIIIRALPAPPIAKSYWICKDTSPDTLLVDQGPYSAQYLSNLRIQWFTDNNTLLDTAPAVPTSDTGLVTYFVRHENQLTGCISPLVALNANIYQVQIDSITNTDASCYTFTDAEINVKGSGPFPVQWSWVDAGTQQGTGPPASSPSYSSGAIINVGAGSYEIVAKDVQGCTSVNYKQNRFFIIDEPAPITINEIVASRPSCHDTNDASIEIFATGRNNLLYSINNGGNWQNTGFFGGLSPYTLNSTYGNEVRRIYNIQVTDSVGCPVYQRTTQPDSTDSKSAVVGITTVTGSLSTGTYDPLLGEGVATSSNYAGENTLNWWPNGNLKITNDASWLTVTVPYNNVQNTQVQYSKLATGTSEVLITRYIAIQLSEINGSDTIFKVISKEDVLNVNSTSGVTGNLPFAVNGGQAIINYNIVEEGIDPGLYKIDIASYHRARITTNTVNDEVSVQAFQGSTFNGTLVVELFEGPKSSFRLEETMPTTVTTSGVVNDISCWGAEDGRIDISWSSTNDVYVSVDSGATYTSVSTAAGYLQYDNLDSGAYYVTLKDENNCYVYYDEIRSYELRSPGPIVLDSILVTPNSCYDPEVNGIENDDAVIQMFAHGGIIPDNDDINYVAPQLVYSIEGGQLGSWSTQNTFASLDTGWYHLKVSNLKNTLQDPMGCVNEYMINPYYYVDQPDSLRLDSVYSLPAQCYDSTDAIVQLFASGGNTVMYSIDSLNFQVSDEFINVAPDDYWPTIKDDKGCQAYYWQDNLAKLTPSIERDDYTKGIQDTLVINEPSPMFITFKTKDLTCNEEFDGEIIVNITGGNVDSNTFPVSSLLDTLMGYTYEWSFDSASAINGQYGYFIDTLSWASAESLWAGTYNVYVEDYKGCFVEGSVTLTQPDSIRLDSVYTRPVTCWDSSNAIIEVYASGGNSLAYVFDTAFAATPADTITAFYDLKQGYTTFLYLEDFVNPDCYVDYKAPRFHYVDSLPTFTMDTAIVTPVLCYGDSTGTILVQTSGGNFPLYNFDTLSTVFDSIGYVSLPSDSVYITITDANGCTPDTVGYNNATRKVFIPQPDPLIVLAETDSNVWCAQDTTGIISAMIFGGTTPYSILWTTGDTTTADSTVSAGLWYVEVTDTNGCYTYDSTFVFAIDSDCDLIADSIETYVDYDLDGLPNAYDLDSDNDGLPDSLEYDYNRDGIPLDDCDGDGWPNYLDPDMCEFYIPSVITPNSDGDNDALFIPGLQYFNNFKFTVFNSMGNKVYQVENSNINFNGSTSGTVVWSTNGSLPSGTYYYVLEIRPNKWTQTGYIFLAR